jgi:hypothetical protein
MGSKNCIQSFNLSGRGFTSPNCRLEDNIKMQKDLKG